MSNDWSVPPRPPGERDMSGLLLSEAQPGFPGHLGGIRLLKFTSDCRRFFCADLEMGVSLREEGREVAAFELDSDSVKTKAHDRVHDFALNADGTVAYVAAGLRLWAIDLMRGTVPWTYRPENLFGFLQSSPRAVGLTKSGSVWCCNDNGTMDLFRPEGVRIARWRANDTPNMVSRMHDGERFVGSDGYGVTVWEPDGHRKALKVRSKVRVYAVRAFPDTERAAVRSDMGVSLVDLYNGDTTRTFNVLPGLPFIDVSPDGRNVLVGEGRGIATYDLDGNKLSTLRVDGDRVITAAFRPSDGGIFAGLESGEVKRIS
jgi:hypothetical protein